MSAETNLDRKKQTLSQTLLFGGLDAQALDKLAALAEWRTVAAQATVFRKGDPGTHLFVIHTGRVKFGSGAADGREVTFNLLGPGEMFGEVAFADGGERTADVVAVEPSELLAISRRGLIPFLRSEPDIMLRMMAMLARRVRWVSESYEDAAFLELPARLAKRLLLLAQHFGFDTPEGRALAVTLPHKELANHMNVTRESINRQIQKWRREGILEQRRGTVIIKNIDRLADCARAAS